MTSIKDQKKVEKSEQDQHDQEKETSFLYKELKIAQNKKTPKTKNSEIAK